MKILHTADLHLGQIIYQNYDRKDEHLHFFDQLTRWCREEQPDALLVSGDVFDIQQPSAAVRKMFNDYFAQLHRDCPAMKIVITAGNHDSASRIQADSQIWTFAGTTLVGLPPADTDAEGWEEPFIVRLENGYVVAVPFLTGDRSRQLQQLLDRVAAENAEGKPVVMMGHAAVTGLDCTGHDMQVGTLATLDPEAFGSGWDYLALGHIHKPQTIGHPDDNYLEKAVYPAPVVRYSGSALHVSCDEAYPHSVSVVEIDRHGGTVGIRQLRIDELRHFHTLPEEGSFVTADEALAAISQFKTEHTSGYLRLRADYAADLPSNFNQMVYELLAPAEAGATEEYRYNPKIIWTGTDPCAAAAAKPVFEVAELQQMSDPAAFVEKTLGQYPGLDMEMVRAAFDEVRAEISLMAEEEAAAAQASAAAKAAKKAAKEAAKQEAAQGQQTAADFETNTDE